MKKVTLDDIVLLASQVDKWMLGNRLKALIPVDIKAAAQEAVEKQHPDRSKDLIFGKPGKVELIALVLALRRAYVECILVPRPEVEKGEGQHGEPLSSPMPLSVQHPESPPGQKIVED